MSSAVLVPRGLLRCSPILLFPRYRALRTYPISSCCTTRPLTSSAPNMAGKIDLNSPSTSWKEAKTFLKGLNNKQRREHYSVKDFIKLKEIPTWKDASKKAKVRQPEEVKFPKSKDLNEKISLIRGDITKLEVDAIVNAELFVARGRTGGSGGPLQNVQWRPHRVPMGLGNSYSTAASSTLIATTVSAAG